MANKVQMFAEPLEVLSVRVPKELKGALLALARLSGVTVGELLHLLASGKVRLGEGGLYRADHPEVDPDVVDAAAEAVRETWSR